MTIKKFLGFVTLSFVLGLNSANAELQIRSADLATTTVTGGGEHGPGGGGGMAKVTLESSDATINSAIGRELPPDSDIDVKCSEDLMNIMEKSPEFSLETVLAFPQFSECSVEFLIAEFIRAGYGDIQAKIEATRLKNPAVFQNEYSYR